MTARGFKEWEVSAKLRSDPKTSNRIYTMTRGNVKEHIFYFRKLSDIFLPKITVKERIIGPWEKVSPKDFL